jgi:hypothetical protein
MSMEHQSVAATREAIEQAIARGESQEDTVNRLGIPDELYVSVRRTMDRVAGS